MPELSRRRVLGGLAAVGLGSVAAGAGTMAAVSDSESSTNNGITAGDLDLTLDGSDSTVQFLSATNVAPGESGSETVTVSNAGSIPGYIDVEVASLTVTENDCAGDENSVDNSCGNPGQGEGELQNELEVHAEFQNGPVLWSGYDTVANKLSAGTVYDRDYQLAGGGSDTFLLEWRFPDDGDDNVAQSDGLTFALTFSLDQQTDQGA